MYPYDLSVPTPGGAVDNWGSALNSTLHSVRSRIAQHEATYGAPIDSFPGATDDDKRQAAMAYAAAQTRPPALVLSARTYTWNRGPDPYYPGLRMVGALGHGEREFLSTGPHTVVNVGAPALFSVPSGGVRGMYFAGIQFRAASGSVHFQEPQTNLASGPIIYDATWRDLAWVGFATIMHARHTRCEIDKTYVNNGTDHQFKLAGSDNFYWMTGGYMSSTVLPANRFYVWFPHMSRTDVGPLYLTPEKATGFRVDGSYSGLQFSGTKLDSTNRNATTACQGAAILISGGRGISFDRCYFFNNCVNPGAVGRTPQDRGQVYIRGSASDLLFQGCQFVGGDAQTLYTPAGTPAIYAASTVSNVKVIAPIAPYGGTRLLQHQAAGIITKYAADDWQLAVA